VSVDPDVVGKALASRLRDLEAAMNRFGAFAFSPGDEAPPPALEEEEAEAAARELVLAALRAAADPTGYRVLVRLRQGDATLSELAEILGVPRLVAWDRVAGLVAAGVVSRSLEGDKAGLTPTGGAVVELVEQAARAAAQERGAGS
jgi:DNA-binding transcriptional ArsR family regulator